MLSRVGRLDVWIAIALGSAVGGVLRQALTEAVTALIGGGFPWGTWLVNVVGSGVIGTMAAAAAAGYPAAWSEVARHAAMTGLLGGFTTFSTFSMQVVALWQQGAWGAAVTYAALSVAVSLLACWAGFTGLQSLAR